VMDVDPCAELGRGIEIRNDISRISLCHKP
jgi:hypothetical protein